MKRVLTLIVLLAVMASLAACAMPAEDKTPPASKTSWWDQQKIRYYFQSWLLWDRLGGRDTSAADVDPVSNEDLIKEIAAAGATIFVDRQNWTFHTDITERTPGYSEDYYGRTRPTILNRARLARKYGLRYFRHQLLLF